MKWRSIARVLLCAGVLVGPMHGPCPAASARPAPAVAPGRYRAILEVPGGELPFEFELELNGGSPTAFLLNGEERVHVDRVTIERDSLFLEIPSFNSRIRAGFRGGALVGTLRLVKRGGRRQIIPFAAAPSPGYRFFPPGRSSRVDVSGRWKVLFRDDEGKNTVAVGEFRQDGLRLAGTFLTPTGDYRYLAGQVSGGEMYLSCFDGAHAFLFRAVYEGDSLRGDFWSGTAWHESWTGHRDPNAVLPDPTDLTHLKAGKETFSFRFPDENGHQVSFDDERFRGKVVIVALAGSWCPNCHDEAAYLSAFYEKNRDRGVEVVALMYEHFHDVATATVQVKHFRRRHKIGYTTLIAGYSDKNEAAGTVPALDHVLAFPTTIFIGRDGKVRRIHTGFSGPGTGEHFESLRNEFAAYVDGLLAERVPQ